MSAARRMKKSYIRPAYANAVDGKVLYLPFVCIYNGRIQTNSGSTYNQVEAYIPFPVDGAIHSIFQPGKPEYIRIRGQLPAGKRRPLHPYIHSLFIPDQPSFVKKHSRKKPGNVYHNNDTITARKNKKQVSTARHSGKQPPHSGLKPFHHKT